MHYKLTNLFGAAAIALIFGFSGVHNVWAQGVVSLGGEASDEKKDLSKDIPDNISLFDDDDASAGGILTPPAKTGNQKAINNALAPKGNVPLLGPNAKAAAGNMPKISVEKKTVTTTTTTTTTQGVKAPVAAAKNAPQAVKGPIPLKGGVPVTAPAAKENPSPNGIINLPAPAGNAPEAAAPAAPKSGLPAVNAKIGTLGNQLIEDVDDSVFAQMSDLEKQTAILSLELRREKIRNEIEALKAVRAKAVEEERIREEERKQKQLEKEKEAERKIYEEKQKLKEIELQYEQLRQEKLLKAYKNKILQEYQKWVKNNAVVFAELSQLKKERQELINDFKGKFNQLTTLSNKATGDAIAVKSAFDKSLADQQTQISVLKALLESSEKANPFAEGGEQQEGKEAAVDDIEEKLSDVYAIMEIRGKGENLSAKLINKEGNTFLIKIGTTLQTGHIVDDIQSTFVRADKNGTKDYLYFAAGGILDKEPLINSELNIAPVSDGEEKDEKSDNAPKEKPKKLIKSRGIPGIVSDMAVK